MNANDFWGTGSWDVAVFGRNFFWLLGVFIVGCRGSQERLPMLIGIAILLVGLQNPPSAHTISGRVSDVDRKPVVGVAVQDVSIILMPGIEIAGRIAVENATGEAASNLLRQLTVSLRPESDSQIVFSPTGVVNSDGSFTIRKVGPGDYALEIGGLPSDCYIKSAFVGREEIVERGLTLYAQSPGPMDIVISPRAGRIEGTIVDIEGAPVLGAQVVLIPEPRLREREGLYRLVQAPNGSFSMRGIRPGSYKLFAWPADETPAYRDPDFIREYENRGEGVQVDVESRVIVRARVIR